MKPNRVRDEWLESHPDIAVDLLVRGLTVESLEDACRLRIILGDIIRFSRAWRKNPPRDDLWDVIAEAENVLSGEW